MYQFLPLLFRQIMQKMTVNLHPLQAYNITPPTILHKESEYQTSTLYVYSATLKDSGVYTCTVRASGSESNQESITIEVQGKSLWLVVL